MNQNSQGFLYRIILQNNVKKKGYNCTIIYTIFLNVTSQSYLTGVLCAEKLFS